MSAAAAMPLLSIVAIAKSFRAGTTACSAQVSVLRELSLALWPGEIVAVTGAAGSGRTTLLQCAAGRLRPDSGSIRWFGARSAPRDRVVYAGADKRRDGTLYELLERVATHPPRILLVDDLAMVGAIERRLVIDTLRSRAAAGAAVLVAIDADGTVNAELSGESLTTRVVSLAHGALTQRRNRSATRIAASSFASRARASARSTYGRSFRSPQ